MSTQSLNTQCPFATRMNAYYDGEVSAAEGSALAAHVPACADCLRELAALQRLSRQLATAAAWPLAGQFERRLHAQIDRQADTGLWRVARGFLAAAACLFLAMVLWVSQTRSMASEPATWETAAVDPQEASAAAGSSDVTVANWIVQDLSTSRAESHP